jgi:hypothetical protein
MSKKGSGFDVLMNSANSVNRVAKEISRSFKDDQISKIQPAKRTKATVRIMISHDFCHFEESIELTGEDIQLFEIDNARKDCQRLADKAVGQYKTAKEKAAKRLSNSYDRVQLQKEVTAIKMKKDEYLTPDDKAKIKALADFDHQHAYDYDDDDVYQRKDN